MPGKRKKSPKKLIKQAIYNIGVPSPRLTKLQEQEDRYKGLRQKFSDYINAVRNRKEVAVFSASQQIEPGKLAVIEVTSLIAGITTANALGKNTELRVAGKDEKGLVKLEVVIVDRIPAPPFVY